MDKYAKYADSFRATQNGFIRTYPEQTKASGSGCIASILYVVCILLLMLAGCGFVYALGMINL